MAASAVVALVADRVFSHGHASQNVARPYITFSVVGGHAENYLTNRPGIDQDLVQIDCWASTSSDCRSLCDAVVYALETRAYRTGAAMDDFEPDTGLYRRTVQFYFWTPRPS